MAVGAEGGGPEDSCLFWDFGGFFVTLVPPWEGESEIAPADDDDDDGRYVIAIAHRR
jgi:hypothetical protein